MSGNVPNIFDSFTKILAKPVNENFLYLVNLFSGASQQAITPEQFGAIGDGNSHPLSSKYNTLIKAQLDYPFATSLTQEIDFCAWYKAILFGNNILGKAGSTYVGMGSWPMSGGYKLSGDPSNFDRIIISRDASFIAGKTGVTLAPQYITVNGNGCIFKDLYLNVYHHTDGLVQFSNIQFIDSLSNGTTFIDSGGNTKIQTLFYMFKWYGLANWTFNNCSWNSINISIDADNALGWLRSHPALNYINNEICFNNCTKYNRTEIDLYGGTNYRFLNFNSVHGGFDDGITAKTRGEIGDTSVNGYTGSVNGVYIIGGTWNNSDALFCAGSDMRWDTSNVFIYDIALFNCGSIVKLKPDGKGASINSTGTVSNVFFNDVYLEDLTGQRFTAAVRLETGEASLGQGGGKVVNVKGNAVIKARAVTANNQLIYWAPNGGIGLIKDINVNIDYIDPLLGVTHDAITAPGYPLASIIGTDVPDNLITTANIDNCNASFNVKYLGGGGILPLWNISSAKLDHLFQDGTLPGVAKVTVPQANHRNIVMTNTTNTRFLGLTSGYNYTGLIGIEQVTISFNSIAAGTNKDFLIWAATKNLFYIGLDLIFDDAVGANATDYRRLSIRTPLIGGVTSPFAALDSHLGWSALTVIRAATLGVDLTNPATALAPKGTPFIISATNAGAGALFPSGRAIIYYQPFGE